MKRYAGQGESRRLEFEQLYKLLYKLEKHVHVTNTMIEAAVSLPQDLAMGFQIKILPCSLERKFPSMPKEGTVESTLHRMYSDVREREKFMDRLKFLCEPSKFTEVLQQKKRGKTIVHAEVLLIDYFDRHGCTFLGGNDRYIGCSKPACYLCHAYITLHPTRYAIPPTHQKLYVGWRLPDINETDSEREIRRKTQEKILLAMIDRVREDVRQELESRTTRRLFHADSTTGMSSVSHKTARSVASIDLPNDTSSDIEETSSVLVESLET